MTRIHSLAELGITRDEDGRLQPGFQVGKDCALADWQHRKEARDFRRVCTNLRIRRWRHSTEKGRAWLKRTSEKWAARARKTDREETCSVCGASVMISKHCAPREHYYCSDPCRRRGVYSLTHPKAKRLTCSYCGKVGHNRRTCSEPSP